MIHNHEMQSWDEILRRPQWTESVLLNLCHSNCISKSGISSQISQISCLKFGCWKLRRYQKKMASTNHPPPNPTLLKNLNIKPPPPCPFPLYLLISVFLFASIANSRHSFGMEILPPFTAKTFKGLFKSYSKNLH